MRLSKYIFLFFFITGSICAEAQQPDTSKQLTLTQCLDIAIKNNLQVKQSNATAESSRIDLRQAKENLIPTINGGVNRTWSQGHAINNYTGLYSNQSQTQDFYGLTSGMTLFNGFALQNAIKSASLAYQAGKMNFQAAKDVVTINVITGFLAILDNEEILAASKSQLAVQKENVDRAEVLAKQGASKAASDLTDQQGNYAASQVAVVNAQNNLDASKLSLFQQMNISYQPDATFQELNAESLKGEYGANPDQVYQTALQQFAAVKAATLTRESADKNVSSLKGVLYPSLTLAGGLNTVYSSSAKVLDTVNGSHAINYGDQLRGNNSSYLTLGLNIPIFSNGIKRNTLAKAKINALYQRDVEENSKIVLKQNVEQAYYNMMAAYKKYQALTEQVRAYTESYRIYKIRYDAGVLTSVDFILAKNALDAATINQISAKYDYFIESKILDYYQGKLSL